MNGCHADVELRTKEGRSPSVPTRGSTPRPSGPMALSPQLMTGTPSRNLPWCQVLRLPLTLASCGSQGSFHS